MRKEQNMKKNSIVTALNPRVLDETVPFAIRESFNLLRTNLMYTISDDESGAPVFAITSDHQGAGKSTVITNLAISFTQIGHRVLLVDADLRRPTIHTYFGINEKSKGLSELMSGIETDVVNADVIPGLDVITSGRIPPNPSELITSTKFANFIADAKTKYDVVFIDFPPIGIVSDAVANCKSISGYIFTVRSGKSSAKSVNESLSSMEKVGAKIAGVVLNDCNIKGSSYIKRKGSRYGGYYGTKY